LSAILSEIDESKGYWSILSIDAYGVGQDVTIQKIQEKAKEKHGCYIGWEDLKFLAAKLDQVVYLTLLCSNSVNALQHYDNLQKQCESCEIVIKRIDDSYWEIFSKDAELIKRLESKFKEVEHLDPNATSQKVMAKR